MWVSLFPILLLFVVSFILLQKTQQTLHAAELDSQASASHLRLHELGERLALDSYALARHHLVADDMAMPIRAAGTLLSDGRINWYERGSTDEAQEKMILHALSQAHMEMGAAGKFSHQMSKRDYQFRELPSDDNFLLHLADGMSTFLILSRGDVEAKLNQGLPAGILYTMAAQTECHGLCRSWSSGPGLVSVVSLVPELRFPEGSSLKGLLFLTLGSGLAAGFLASFLIGKKKLAS